jgi:hypothetical protein
VWRVAAETARYPRRDGRASHSTTRRGAPERAARAVPAARRGGRRHQSPGFVHNRRRSLRGSTPLAPRACSRVHAVARRRASNASVREIRDRRRPGSRREVCRRTAACARPNARRSRKAAAAIPRVDFRPRVLVAGSTEGVWCRVTDVASGHVLVDAGPGEHELPSLSRPQRPRPLSGMPAAGST